MTVVEAKNLLLLHSYSHPDPDHPKMSGGFLGSLRPYTGLKEENFQEVMEAIEALSDAYQDQPVIDKEIAEAVFGICFYSWAWAISPDGMLPRDGLIDVHERQLLEEWLYAIGEAVSQRLLFSRQTT